MLLIQAATGLLLLGYFFSPPVRAALVGFSDFKDRTGLAFVLLSGFVSGGLLPEIAKALLRQVTSFDKEWLKRWAFTGLVYAGTALAVRILYTGQTLLFGETASVLTMLYKVAFDLLVFTPLFSIPYSVAMFGWRDHGFSRHFWNRFFTIAHYGKQVFPPVVMCWAFWGPVLMCIYTLPERLQFVVSALCMAAWSLLFVFMVARE